MAVAPWAGAFGWIYCAHSFGDRSHRSAECSSKQAARLVGGLPTLPTQSMLTLD